jgi:serine O-acetyltransferase
MPTQSFDQLLALIASDMYRYRGQISVKEAALLIWKERGFAATLPYRLARFCHINQYKWWGLLAKLLYRLTQEHMLFELPYQVPAGPGLKITHVTGMVINHEAILGRDVHLSHTVTLGHKPAGSNAGAPTLNNRIYVAPGAQIIGGITLADDVAVGANAVVTKSVPAHSVVVGIPAKVLSDEGSAAYCVHLGYADQLPNLPLLPANW